MPYEKERFFRVLVTTLTSQMVCWQFSNPSSASPGSYPSIRPSAQRSAATPTDAIVILDRAAARISLLRSEVLDW